VDGVKLGVVTNNMNKQHKNLIVALCIATVLIVIAHLLWHGVRVLDMSTSIFYMDEKLTLAAYLTTVLSFFVGLTVLSNGIGGKGKSGCKCVKMSKECKNKREVNAGGCMCRCGKEVDGKVSSWRSWVVNALYGSFFVWLSMDEHFEIHEYMNGVIKGWDNMLGAWANTSWIFSLSLIILAVFVIFIMKYRDLSKVARRPFLYGLGLFVVILIFEMLGALSYGHDIYVYYVAVEEGAEMMSMVMFAAAALIEKDERGKSVTCDLCH
jgi:hypothetical protein